MGRQIAAMCPPRAGSEPPLGLAPTLRTAACLRPQRSRAGLLVAGGSRQAGGLLAPCTSGQPGVQRACTGQAAPGRLALRFLCYLMHFSERKVTGNPFTLKSSAGQWPAVERGAAKLPAEAPSL